MLALDEIAIRILVYGFVFALLFMRASVPNPIYSLFLRNTVVDRCLTAFRPVVEWSLFVGMGPSFHDVRIDVRLQSGKQVTWYLLRDEEIGPIQIKSPLSRLTLAFYSRDWSFFAPAFCERLVADFAAAGDPIVQLEVVFQTFSSEGSQEEIDRRSSPVYSQTLYAYRPAGSQQGIA